MPDLQMKLQRLDAETAKKLAEVGGSGSIGPQ